MTDTMDEIGRLADQLDNALYALKLPSLPDRIHIEGLSGTMREVRDKLAEIVKRETGENPWGRMGRGWQTTMAASRSPTLAAPLSRI